MALDQHGKSIPGGIRGHALVYALGQIQKQDLVHGAYVNNGFRFDYRNYDDVYKILSSLSIKKMRFLTNNPDKIKVFEENSFEIEHMAIEKPYKITDSEELGVKKLVCNHMLQLDSFKEDDVSYYGLDPKIVFNK